MNWTAVCALQDIVPGSGVCALLGEQQIALFRPYDSEEVYALSNIDPFYQSSVLSRGLIIEYQQQLWVASPLKKQHFRLSDGLCLESEAHSLRSFPVRVDHGLIKVAE